MSAFWLLCVTLSLTVFLLGCTAGTLIASLTAAAIWRYANKARLLRLPGLLLSVRLFPLVLGAALTFGFALPSFLLLEPHRSVEVPEPHLIVLAGLALAVIVLLIGRCVRLHSKSRKIRKEWLRGAELLTVSHGIPIHGVDAPDSLIAVLGILHPGIFIGRSASADLTQEELQAAVAHELAHVRSLDNFKLLLLKITRLPFFGSLTKMDLAWSGAAELRADAAALRQGASALELSSAILKVSRLRTLPTEFTSVAASHLIPPQDSPSTLAVRIEHLQNALEMRSHRKPVVASYRGSFALLLAVAYLLLLPTALPLVHRWMEWLAK